MTNVRRQSLELPADLVSLLPKEAGEAINDRLRRIGEHLEATSGLRGKVHLANKVRMESNRIMNVPDPERDLDLINLRTLLRFRRCDFLVSQLEQCNEYPELLDDVADPTLIEELDSPLFTSEYFFGYSVLPFEQTSSSGIGAIDDIVAWGFALPFRCRVTRVTIENTASRGGASASCGLYDENKTLALNSGLFSVGTASVKTITISPVTLEPGFYYLAVYAQGIPWRLGATSGALASVTYAFINKNANRQGVNSVAGVGGALPATLGTLGANANDAPIVLFEA